MRTSTTQPPLGTSLNRSHTLSKGLVGAWLLNEGGGQKAMDSCVSTNFGTLTNGAVFRQDLNGNCVSCDGTDDYVGAIGQLSTYSFVQNTQVFTLSVWVKLNNNTARQVLFGTTLTGTQKGFFLMYETLGTGFGTKALRYQGCKAGDGVQIILTQSPDNSITDLNWHHCVVTGGGSGNTISFYIDGAIKTTTYNTNFTSLSSGDSTNKLEIGAPNTTPQLPLNGKINNVMIYNRTLSATEVRQLYTNPYQLYIGKVR